MPSDQILKLVPSAWKWISPRNRRLLSRPANPRNPLAASGASTKRTEASAEVFRVLPKRRPLVRAK